MVAVGSSSLETLATNRCTLKKIITVIDANAPPMKPAFPFKITSTIKPNIAAMAAGTTAPCQSFLSLTAVLLNLGRSIMFNYNCIFILLNDQD